MPQYHLPHGTEAAERKFTELDAFTRGYIEAMFFTSATPDDEELEHVTFSDLAPEALSEIIADCTAFNLQADAWLHKAYTMEKPSYDMEQAGRDFWFTRCGHGVGFWDRGLGATGEELSEIARKFGNRDMVLGDDKKVYVE